MFTPTTLARRRDRTTALRAAARLRGRGLVDAEPGDEPGRPCARPPARLPSARPSQAPARFPPIGPRPPPARVPSARPALPHGQTFLCGNRVPRSPASPHRQLVEATLQRVPRPPKGHPPRPLR